MTIDHYRSIYPPADIHGYTRIARCPQASPQLCATRDPGVISRDPLPSSTCPQGVDNLVHTRKHPKSRGTASLVHTTSPARPHPGPARAVPRGWPLPSDAWRWPQTTGSTHNRVRTTLCTTCARRGPTGDDASPPTAPLCRARRHPRRCPQLCTARSRARTHLSTRSTPPMTTMSPLSIRSLPHA